MTLREKSCESLGYSQMPLRGCCLHGIQLYGIYLCDTHFYTPGFTAPAFGGTARRSCRW